MPSDDSLIWLKAVLCVKDQQIKSVSSTDGRSDVQPEQFADICTVHEQAGQRTKTTED